MKITTWHPLSTHMKKCIKSCPHSVQSVQSALDEKVQVPQHRGGTESQTF